MATLFASGTSTGSGSITANAALSQLLSGTTLGSGVLSIPLLLAAGTAFGLATVTGAAGFLIGVSGRVQGQGKLLLSGYPDTLYGTSAMTGELVVERMPPTVCYCSSASSTADGSISNPGGPFKWEESFQVGDLSLFVRDSVGSVNPNAVSYTLYWIRNGVPYQAGPANRVPARGPSVGQFYVTGRVGDFGQPGDWMVRWYYQRFLFSETNVVEYRFVVQDALAAADPRDSTVRVLKYGWD